MGRRLIADETDAAQRMGFGVAQSLIEVGEADGCEGFERVGHEAFAAGFVDGRLHCVDDFDVKALMGSGDSAGEAGWACSNDDDVALARAEVHSVFMY
jgi:hypothetical protein